MTEEPKEEKVTFNSSPEEETAPEPEEETIEAVEVEEESDPKTEVQKYKDLYLRSEAEMENMRKRLEREKMDSIKFANESLIKDLLPELDNMERALDHAQKDGTVNQAIIDGVLMTYNGVMNVLDRFGVKTIAAAGEVFDPNFHEAVMQREDPDVEENTVLDVVQKGYLLRDRLIRPAMVIVSKRPAGAA